VRHISNGVDLSESLAFIYYSAAAQMCLGEICLEMAEYQKARDHYDKAVEILEQHMFLPSMANLNRVGSSMARVMNNDKNIDVESLQTYVSENKLPIYEGWMRRYMGVIHLNTDGRHISEAQNWIEEAIEADERNGMRFHLAQDYALYAELFKRKGETFRAKEQLGKAIEIYKACGADGWVTKAEEEMAKL
jgi:tetratricopeptide (TPR) repeat protein